MIDVQSARRIIQKLDEVIAAIAAGAVTPSDQWIHEVPAVGSGAADEYVYAPAVAAGKRVTMEMVGGRDEDNACTYLEFGILLVDGTTWHPLEYVWVVMAGVLYTMNRAVTLEAGQRLGIRFNGSVAADDLWLYAVGRETNA